MAPYSAEILVSELSAELDGSKAVGRAKERALRAVEVGADTLGSSMREMCRYLNEVVESAQTQSEQFSLDTVEVVVEVTAKGGVRLVGTASAELKGGLKLVFKRA